MLLKLFQPLKHSKGMLQTNSRKVEYLWALEKSKSTLMTHENKPMFTQPREPETSLLLPEKIPFKPQAGKQDTNSALRGFFCTLGEHILTVHHAHNCQRTRGRKRRLEVRSVGFIGVHYQIYIYNI